MCIIDCCAVALLPSGATIHQLTDVRLLGNYTAVADGYTGKRLQSRTNYELHRRRMLINGQQRAKADCLRELLQLRHKATSVLSN